MPDWLARMNPPPPEELATAIRAALGGVDSPSAEEMLRAAEQLLKKVVDSDCEARSSAIDLLTVDALVTQALLIASDDNARNDFSEEAMRILGGTLADAMRGGSKSK